MAQKTTVHLVDDIDGTEADETVSFSLDGREYEIDLTSAHASALRDAFAQYVGAARKSGGGSGPRRSTSGRARSGSSGDRQRVQDMRAWAKSNGHTVSDRGRIPGSVVAAYNAAH